MKNLELFCVHDATLAPVAFKLNRSSKGPRYSCKIPDRTKIKELVVFTQGLWTDMMEENSTIDIDIIGGQEPLRLGCMSESLQCFKWMRTEENASKLPSSGKISLLATVSAKVSLETQMESKDLKQINESTPLAAALSLAQSPLPTKPRKRTREETRTPKLQSRRQKVAMRALNVERSPLAKVKPEELLCLNTEIVHANLAKSNNVQSKPARCVDLSSRAPMPSSRWGHSMTLINSNLAILTGGQGYKQQLNKDSIWSLDPETRSWKSLDIATEGIKPEYRTGHTATFEPTMRCIYIYGGSKQNKWFHDVHMFDLDEKRWNLIKTNGNAPTRAYHTSTLFRHELWVFGGVFPRPDPQPDGCDNEIHIFSPVMESWYKPIVMGQKPPPRSGHSATLINDLLVVFGGWDFPYCYNDICILDLATVDWSTPKVYGTPPKPRSWHTSCALTNDRIFIHGGYDGDNALHDAHIFSLKGSTWQELILENAPSARAGHACLRLYSDYENQEEDEIIIFGGGDNDGSYFSDMLSFYVPF